MCWEWTTRAAIKWHIQTNLVMGMQVCFFKDDFLLTLFAQHACDIWGVVPYMSYSNASWVIYTVNRWKVIYELPQKGKIDSKLK